MEVELRILCTNKIGHCIKTYFRSKSNIEYYLEGSSGLYLLRGKSLSYGSDVDIFVLKYDELLILAQELPKIFSDLNIEIVNWKIISL